MNLIYSYHIIKNTETKIYDIQGWNEVVDILESKYSKTIWIVDSTFQNEPFFQTLENKIVLEGGESTKSIHGFIHLLENLSSHQIDKKSILIAVGGGSISDLVGFAASVYQRGIAFATIPTTLLNIVDAAIGGKNGINFLNTKNQIGTIYQPDYIFHFHEIFSSLSRKDLADGFAEIIKYGLIGNFPLIEKLATRNLDLISSNHEQFKEIINSCIIQKISIIEQDPYDMNLRRTLNFGHTIGHAIESYYGLSHGQSVGLGMLFSAKLSAYFYGLDNNLFEKIQTILSQYHLPIRLKEFNGKELTNKILRDKKISSDSIDFLLLKEIGTCSLEKLELKILDKFIRQAEEEKWISE